MRTHITPVLAVLFFFAAGAVKADDLANANLAFDKKDYARAFDLYEPLAHSGISQAQSALGSMYYFGNGVSRNWIQADMWFSLAARSRSATAIVADTNRRILERLMPIAEVKLAANMADECLASRFARCGLTRYAQR